MNLSPSRITAAASAWRDWIDSLDSPGGHNLLSFLGLLVGVALEASSQPGGETLRIAFMGSLLRGMVGAESNVKRFIDKVKAANGEEKASKSLLG